MEIPVAVALPMRIFELVLHEKQPVPNPRGNDHHWEISFEYWAGTEQDAGQAERDQQREIQQQDAPQRLTVPQLVTLRKTLQHDEVHRRTEHDHYQRIPE